MDWVAWDKENTGADYEAGIGCPPANRSRGPAVDQGERDDTDATANLQHRRRKRIVRCIDEVPVCPLINPYNRIRHHQ